MKIVGMIAENYKKLRIVEIVPKDRMVQITGKNGQGKTSVLDAVWAGLVGSKAFAEKPVRKGAEKARIKLNLGELTVTRTISAAGAHMLTVETAAGSKIASPQKLLDELLGELTFDPLEFVNMKPKQQIEAIRQVVKLPIDVDALNQANQADYEDRTIVNREIARLETEIAAILVQAELPKEKINDAEILAQIAEADTKNRGAREVDAAKQSAGARVEAAEQNALRAGQQLNNSMNRVEELKNQLERAQKEVEVLRQSCGIIDAEVVKLRSTHEAMPAGQYVEVADLTRNLEQAQLINREIDRRSIRDGLQKKLDSFRRTAEELSRSMEQRYEQKATAVREARMPIEGLAFDEACVTFHGIPIEQLGEAEQIRVSVSIAMAANPKLRILRILHGEALDDDSLAIMAMMAEQNDFQIWMSKVDSSGKVGIVMEDGMIKQPAAGDGG